MGYMNNDGLLYFWTKLKTIFVRTVNGNGPDPNGNVTIPVPSASSTTPKMDGTAEVGSETAFARGDHVHPTDTSRAASSHTHGNISNAGGLQIIDVAIENGDKLVVTDASNSNKVARTSVTFDGTTETKALTPKGTWANIPKAGTVTPKMDGTAAVGSSAKYAKEDHVHPTDTTRATGNGRIFYGTTSTAASTAAKTVTCANFTSADLVKGTILVLVFNYKNTATLPTLNVNSTGAKEAYWRWGADMVGFGKMESEAGHPYIFVYDGTQWLTDYSAAAYSMTPEMDGTSTYGSSVQFARGDHRHPTDTSRAPVASPAFTGTPTAPTAAVGTNNDQIATTSFVNAAVAAAASGVASFKGAVTAQSQIDAVANIQTGWYWVVDTAGTYYGQDCESGDFIYVTSYEPARKSGDNTKWDDANFTIIQTNITPMTNTEIDTIVAS